MKETRCSFFSGQICPFAVGDQPSWAKNALYGTEEADEDKCNSASLVNVAFLADFQRRRKFRRILIFGGGYEAHANSRVLSCMTLCVPKMVPYVLFYALHRNKAWYWYCCHPHDHRYYYCKWHQSLAKRNSSTAVHCLAVSKDLDNFSHFVIVHM